MSNDNDTIEGTAVEVDNDKPEPEPAPNANGAVAEPTALIPSRAEGTLMPLPTDQVIEGMKRYQQLLRELLEPSDWQTEDKKGKRLEKPFLKKSGWRKIARAFNLSFQRVDSSVEREESGIPVRAEVWIRAIAPNGQFGDGDGYCDARESRFQSWRGRQKLENDLRSTATTRAKNRAISDLVGMGEVSAEEVDASGAGETANAQTRAGAQASKELAQVSFKALVALLGDGDAAQRVGEKIVADYGHLPVAAGRALAHAAGELASQNGKARGKGEAGQTQESGDGELSADAALAGELAQVLAIARDGGYARETVRQACQVMLGKDDLAELEGLQPRQLYELLKTARAGETGDELLARALTAAAAQDDPESAAREMRTWLVERARRGNEPGAAAA